MSDEYTERDRIVDELYTMLDQGLDKKSAYQLADLIEKLADLRVNAAFGRIADGLAQQTSEKGEGD